MAVSRLATFSQFFRPQAQFPGEMIQRLPWHRDVKVFSAGFFESALLKAVAGKEQQGLLEQVRECVKAWKPCLKIPSAQVKGAICECLVLYADAHHRFRISPA